MVAVVDDLYRVATLLGGEPGHGPIVEYQQLVLASWASNRVALPSTRARASSSRSLVSR
jgi:hypothetical protein